MYFCVNFFFSANKPKNLTTPAWICKRWKHQTGEFAPVNNQTDSEMRGGAQAEDWWGDGAWDPRGPLEKLRGENWEPL